MPGGMIGDAGEDVGEPGTSINAVEFAGFDQCVHRGRTVSARVRTAERPVLSPDRNAAHGAFGGVVAHADAAVIKEAREGRPSFEAVVDGFGNGCF